MKKIQDLNILCVDDEPFILEVLTDFMRIYGITDVDVAQNGQEALECFEAKDYDVVLSDVAMPKMDGFELMKQIRESGRKQPAILLMSGHSHPSISKTIAFGANAFINKPIDSSILLSILRGLTGKILVIEDSATIRQMTTTTLRRFGYDVIEAEDGTRALELFNEETPDVVILDLLLPKISGFEVLEQLRTVHSSLEVPVIVATSSTKRSSLLHCMAIGANDVIYKPVQTDTLLMRIRNQLTMRSLGLEMTKAKEQALESAHIKGRFLANMSHEIRTPLNSIIGMSSYVRTMEMSDEQAECLDIIADAGDTLLRTVNDILDFSKAEALELALESIPFNLNKSLDNLVSGAKHTKGLKKDRGANVELLFETSNVPNGLKGDPQRIKQVIYNLMGNALKFTSSGKVIVKVTGKPAGEGCSTILFEIMDTGIGIPEDKMATIFTPFSQADASTSRQYGGTGLGLTICSAIVKLMGGELKATSQVGHGSKFFFEITLPHAEFVEDTIDVSASEELPKGLHILVTDDTENNQKVARKMLKKLGHEVAIASNGMEAIDLIRANDFDLVFMDCQMPVMDGYTASEEIRKLPDGKGRLPVIAMTAHVSMGEREKCVSAGMDDYMSKPFLLEDLQNMLTKWSKARSDWEHPSEDTGGTNPDNLIDFILVKQLTDLQDEDEPNFFYDQTMLFYKRAMTLFNHIKESIDEKDAPALMNSAHALKGSAAVVGAKKVAAVCAVLEDMGTSGELLPAEQLIEDLDYSLKETRVAFDEIVTKLNKAS